MALFTRFMRHFSNNSMRAMLLTTLCRIKLPCYKELQELILDENDGFLIPIFFCPFRYLVSFYNNFLSFSTSILQYLGDCLKIFLLQVTKCRKFRRPGCSSPRLSVSLGCGLVRVRGGVMISFRMNHVSCICATCILGLWTHSEVTTTGEPQLRGALG